MIKHQNDCVGCAETFPCIGDVCCYRNVPHYHCDECGEEDALYYFDDDELCIHCVEKRLNKVTDWR